VFFLHSSFFGSTAQLRPWPPPQNPAEFLGGFSTIFFLQGRGVSPTPNLHLGGPDLCIYILPYFNLVTSLPEIEVSEINF
jgi:hypothetical protein